MDCECNLFVPVVIVKKRRAVSEWYSRDFCLFVRVCVKSLATLALREKHSYPKRGRV